MVERDLPVESAPVGETECRVASALSPELRRHGRFVLSRERRPLSRQGTRGWPAAGFRGRATHGRENCTIVPWQPNAPRSSAWSPDPRAASMPISRWTSWPAWPTPPAPRSCCGCCRSGRSPTRPRSSAAARWRPRGRVRRSSTSDVVIFDNELTPAQLAPARSELERKVVDRTQLILDIFARRARTREGKWQVELAQLKYLLPRLVGSGDRAVAPRRRHRHARPW